MLPTARCPAGDEPGDRPSACRCTSPRHQGRKRTRRNGAFMSCDRVRPITIAASGGPDDERRDERRVAGEEQGDRRDTAADRQPPLLVPRRLDDEEDRERHRDEVVARRPRSVALARARGHLIATVTTPLRGGIGREDDFEIVLSGRGEMLPHPRTPNRIRNFEVGVLPRSRRANVSSSLRGHVAATRRAPMRRRP